MEWQFHVLKAALYNFDQFIILHDRDMPDKIFILSPSRVWISSEAPYLHCLGWFGMKSKVGIRQPKLAVYLQNI
jgi:hypothetical protein